MVTEISSLAEAVGISASLVRHCSALFSCADKPLEKSSLLLSGKWEFLQITNQIMLTWVGFSSLAVMNIKEKCQNV